MYLVFGKYWVLWDMKQGLRMAVMVNEAEIAMHRAKIRTHQDAVNTLKSELEDLKKIDPIADLEMGEDKKAYYDAKKVRESAHETAIAELEGKIRAQEDNVSGTDGELQRIYNIAYHNKMKLDFVSSYKPSKSYADTK